MAPIKSTYRWKSRIVIGKEFVLLIKSRMNLYVEIEKAIKSLHSYKVPEVISVKISSGNGDYLSWLDEQTG